MDILVKYVFELRRTCVLTTGDKKVSPAYCHFKLKTLTLGFANSTSKFFILVYFVLQYVERDMSSTHTVVEGGHTDPLPIYIYSTPIPILNLI